MDDSRLLLISMVRLKALRLTSDLERDYDDYCYKFNKIMDALDENQLSIPKRLEDILFDAGLSEGSKWLRNRNFDNKLKNNVSKLDGKFKKQEKVEFIEYHKANGHAAFEVLKRKANTQNLEIINVIECKTCSSHQFMIDFINGPNSKKPVTLSESILDTFHFHLSSEFPIIGFSGVGHFLLIIDDYSKMMFIYTIQHRQEIMKIIFKFLVHCGRFRENSIKKIITDDNDDFTNQHVELFLRKRNIRHEKIGPKQKDSFVDYYARNIQVMLKLIMADAEGIDPSLWSEAIKAAVYIYNNLPNESLNWNTPSEIWLDKTLVLAKKFYPFGKHFMAVFQNQKVKLKKCRFVGYHPHETAFYRFYCPKDETIGFGQVAHELFEKEDNGEQAKKEKDKDSEKDYNLDSHHSKKRHSSDKDYNSDRERHRSKCHLSDGNHHSDRSSSSRNSLERSHR